MRNMRIARSHMTTSSTRKIIGLIQADCTMRCTPLDTAVLLLLSSRLDRRLDFNPLVKSYYWRQSGVKSIGCRGPQCSQNQISHVGQPCRLRVLRQKIAAENHAQRRAVRLVKIRQCGKRNIELHRIDALAELAAGRAAAQNISN